MENVQKTITTDTSHVIKIGTATKAGIFTSVGLILYFVSMNLLGFQRNLELHYLNIFILFFGLRYGIKSTIKTKGEVRYFEGLKTGLIITILSVAIFNVFMVIYETAIDPSFLEYLKENISLGDVFSTQETIFNIAGLITLEGLSSGFILTFILMQYYKSERSETV